MARFSLTRWWKQARRKRLWRIVEVVQEADDIPATIPELGAVLVDSAGFKKWLAIDCPCESGHRVLLNLDPGRWPSWRIIRTAPLSIWPSVDERTGDRRCHYMILDGRIIWARDWQDE